MAAVQADAVDSSAAGGPTRAPNCPGAGPGATETGQPCHRAGSNSRPPAETALVMPPRLGGTARAMAPGRELGSCARPPGPAAPQNSAPASDCGGEGGSCNCAATGQGWLGAITGGRASNSDELPMGNQWVRCSNSPQESIARANAYVATLFKQRHDHLHSRQR